MDNLTDLIEDIEAFCRRHAMAESTFGRMAVNDGKFVGRLRSGGSVTTKSISKVRSFMEGTTSAKYINSSPDATTTTVKPERTHAVPAVSA